MSLATAAKTATEGHNGLDLTIVQPHGQPDFRTRANNSHGTGLDRDTADELTCTTRTHQRMYTDADSRIRSEL